MRRMLVTGGAGFIGASLVHHWVRTHPSDRIVVIDALTYAGSLARLAGVESQLRFVCGDICDTTLVENLLRDDRIDCIVHCAAESHVDRSIAQADAFIETNIVGTYSLLKAARKVWLQERHGQPHRFHHVSTDEVYGSKAPGGSAAAESAAYAPNSPYSASKAAADHLVRAFHRTYDLETTVSHCCNTYGQFQLPEKLIPLVITHLLEGKPLPVYGDGLNLRNWLHVDDHCRAIDCILTRGRCGETYNICGPSEHENVALVERLCDLIDEAFGNAAELSSRFPDAPPAHGRISRGLIRFVEDRPGHDRRYAIDGSRLQEETAFAPEIVLEEGLRRTVDWYLSNEAWWRGFKR